MTKWTWALVLLGLLLSPLDSAAQQLEMRPLSVHIQTIEQDSIGTLRYVARRCAALYTLIAEVSEAPSPELSERFAAGVPSFIAMAVRAEQELGSSQADALEATEMAIRDIMPLYQERMRRNMAATGSYFVDDPLLGEDIQICGAVIAPD